MPIAVTCKCGKKMSVRDEMAGRKGKCPACGSLLEVPKAGAASSIGKTPAPASKPPTSVGKTPSATSKPPSSVGPKPISKPGSPTPGGPASKPPGKTGVTSIFSKTPAGKTPSDPGKKEPGSSTARFCPTCNAPVGLRDIFCETCGSSLEKRDQARKGGKTADKLSPAVARKVVNPWVRAAWIGGPIAGIALAAGVWWMVWQGGQIRRWQDNVKQKEGGVPRPRYVDTLMGMEWRERKQKAPRAIEENLDRMGSVFFETRKQAYEELYHMVNLSDSGSSYSPDLSWWERRPALNRLKEWWNQGKSRMRWDPKGKFLIPGAGAPEPPPAENAPAEPPPRQSPR